MRRDILDPESNISTDVQRQKERGESWHQNSAVPQMQAEPKVCDGLSGAAKGGNLAARLGQNAWQRQICGNLSVESSQRLYTEERVCVCVCGTPSLMNRDRGSVKHKCVL